MKSILSTNAKLPDPRHRRAGSLYVSVMGVTLIVSMLGLSAMLAARVHLKEAVNATAQAEAQKLAASAIEYGMCAIKDNANWRTTYTHNVEITPIPLGQGTVSFKLVDTDGLLQDDSTDSARLIGIGRVNGVTYQESILLMPTGAGLGCTETAFHCNSLISLGSGVTFDSNQIVSSNGSIIANNPLVALNADAEAVGTITGNVTGSRTAGVPVRKMPGSDAFDYYKYVGTWIDINSLPLDGGGKPIIDKKRISPGLNPFGGPTNLEGIYVIDCGGQKLTIQNSRISGTIVILNPGPGSNIFGAMQWQAAVKNYPALLVNGNIEIRTTTIGLSEPLLGTNFNPASFPYEGVSDNDTSDTYPSDIIGLVYVSGYIDFPTDLLNSKFTGCVICPSCVLNSALEVNYYNTYRDYAPPGFAVGPQMAIIPGTRRREP